VRGSGNWAELADGIIVGRRRVDAVMLCDWCAIKVMHGEIILAPRRAASAIQVIAEIRTTTISG
jgi:hypothetical protein